MTNRSASGRRRSVIAVLALVGLAMTAVGHLAPARAGADYVRNEEYFLSGDGTMLHAQIFRPADIPHEQPTPVVLRVSPYGLHDDVYHTTGRSPEYGYAEFAEAFDRGYTLVIVSLRGYGHSEGCGDLFGPGEQADVVAAVRWAATRPWSSGAVGILGLSYEAWPGIVGVAEEPEGLRAVVVASPVVSAYRTMYMEGVPYFDPGRVIATSQYAAADAASGTPESGVRACWAETSREVLDNDPSTAFWQERELVEQARDSRIPVFWSHGFQDLSVKPDHLMALFPYVSGRSQAWLGQFPHQFPDEVAGEAYADAAFDWLDRHLRHMPDSDGPAVDQVKVQDDEGRWRSERVWPPTDAVPFNLPMAPGSYLDVPSKNVATAKLAGPQGVWMFTQPLPHALHIAGSPSAELDVDVERPGAQVVARMYDVDEDNVARLITRGAALGRRAGQQRIVLEFYPQDWTLEPGHRLGMLIAGGSDDRWLEPGGSGGRVTLATGTLEVPFLRMARTAFVDGQPAAVPGTFDGAGPFTLDETTVDRHEQVVSLPPPMRPHR